MELSRTCALRGVVRNWDAVAVAAFLKPFFDWADAHKINRNRLLLGEFGCWRRLPGCADYLKDVQAAVAAAHIHQAFYSWRDDSGDAMNYELGSGPAPAGYLDSSTISNPDVPSPTNSMTTILRAGLTKMREQ